ncbi:MAG: efflux RND transporter periplasmic adaptor subunit [Rhizobiales bacterium]|nr:efflux RND transporter periplasmic adaptor subunit [Hyphomicrobiales bacterium]
MVRSRRAALPSPRLPDADRIARVAVRLVGTVAELRKRVGDPVEAGEAIAMIESREVADAKSDYLGARLLFELQQKLFNRSKTLFEGKVLAENEYLRAEVAFQDARVKFEAARQKLFALSLTAQQIAALPQQPGETLRLQELRAPITGRVAERRVEVGSLVGREGQESELFVIIDQSAVWVDLTILPSDLSKISAGQRITIAAEAGSETAPATVLSINPVLDKDTRAARVVASLDNAEGRWRPGAFITARIPFDQSEAPVVVPASALQTLEGKPSVFVRTPEGFAGRAVSLGRQGGGRVEITAGLDAGEHIATANTFVLKADLGKSAIGHQH